MKHVDQILTLFRSEQLTKAPGFNTKTIGNGQASSLLQDLENFQRGRVMTACFTQHGFARLRKEQGTARRRMFK